MSIAIILVFTKHVHRCGKIYKSIETHVQNKVPGIFNVIVESPKQLDSQCAVVIGLKRVTVS